MAYYRPSMLPANVSESNGTSTTTIDINKNDIIHDKEKSKDERPLTLFSIDLSSLSPTIQYIVLAFGLILFMCLYGYYQELVVYGWFDRKLSIFSTFLHFLGCLSFAQLQRNLSKRSNNNIQQHSQQHGPFVFTLGTAPPKIAIFYYLLLIFVRTGAQGMSNLSMTQINYPAKVLFKSASPIITMIIGITWFRKTYPIRDYIVVVLLILGLYIFITSDHSASPQSTKLGIIYVVISLFGSAAIPMIQEHCMITYNSSIEDLLYHTFLGSAIVSFILACISGEFIQGIYFLIQTGSIHTWFIMFAFTIFGFIGTNFSAALTLQYGALVNGITNTFRKAVTLGLSFLLFPDRNEITGYKIIGSIIFFSGLIVRILSKTENEKKTKKVTYKEHKHEIDVETGVLRSETSIIDNTNNSSSSNGSSNNNNSTNNTNKIPYKNKLQSLSIHTNYYGNNGSTDFGQLLSIDETYIPGGDDSSSIESGDETKYSEKYDTNNTMLPYKGINSTDSLNYDWEITQNNNSKIHNNATNNNSITNTTSTNTNGSNGKGLKPPLFYSPDKISKQIQSNTTSTSNNGSGASGIANKLHSYYTTDDNSNNEDNISQDLAI